MSFYNEAIEFFVENGIKLNEDQILALQEKGEEEKAMKADKKARKSYAKSLANEIKSFVKSYGLKLSPKVNSKGFENQNSNTIVITMVDTFTGGIGVNNIEYYESKKIKEFKSLIDANAKKKLIDKLNNISEKFVIDKLSIEAVSSNATFTITISEKE